MKFELTTLSVAAAANRLPKQLASLAVKTLHSTIFALMFLYIIVWRLTVLLLLFKMIPLFLTPYHCSSKMRHFLHRCDRAMIYIFIASSYFPWLTVGNLSCWMLRELRWAIWLLAVLGITYQQIFHERYKMLELLLYLVMGLGPAAIIVTSNVCCIRFILWCLLVPICC